MIINFSNFVNESVDSNIFVPKDIFRKYKVNKYQLYKIQKGKNKAVRAELGKIYHDNREKVQKEIESRVLNKIVKFTDKKGVLCQNRVNGLLVGNDQIIFKRDLQESNMFRIIRGQEPLRYWWIVDINKPIEVIEVDKTNDPYDEEDWELNEF